MPTARRIWGGALIGGDQNQLEYTGDYGRYAVPENTYEVNDAVSIARGHHNLKIGNSGIRRDVADFRPIAGKGYFQIGNGDFTGYEVSELLAGFVNNYSIGAQCGFYGTRTYVCPSRNKAGERAIRLAPCWWPLIAARQHRILL